MKFVYIKSAHWPWIGYQINIEKKSVRNVLLFFKKKNGYGIKIGNNFVALYEISNEMFFIYNQESINVSSSTWTAKIVTLGKYRRCFYLQDSGVTKLEFEYNDYDQSKSISPEQHFLMDVVEWLRDDASRRSYVSLIG